MKKAIFVLSMILLVSACYELTAKEKNMGDALKVIARFEVKKDKISLVKSEAIKLLGPTRKEKGCIHYSLQQDTNNPNILVFIEHWETKRLWEDHKNSNHLKAFLSAVEGAFVDVDVTSLKEIDKPK